MVTEMLEEIELALKRFGEYTYLDKGPGEVMDVDVFVGEVRQLPVAEAGEVLLELAAASSYGAQLASDLLCDMQDWDEIFDNEEVADLL